MNLTRTPAADPSQPGPGGRRHTFRDLYHEHTNYQFIDRSWRWAVLSGSMVLISLLFLVFSGLNLGIDFTGGTQWSFTVDGASASAADVRDVLSSQGQANAKVLILGSSGVRVQTEELKPAERTKITDALAKYANVDVSKVSVTNVGPTWGDRVSKKALQALVVFFIAIALYLSLRFEARMALAAIIAVVHDIIITAGVYAITGFEVTPGTVVAFLTILGFSLYDTVVVFDKVKENEDTLATSKGDTYSMMVNRSLNQVLMRSLNTSFVAVLPVVSLLVVGRFGLGAVGLQDFALALFVGLMTGAYSSIYVATPIVAVLKEREPKFRSIRERIAVQRSREGVAPPAARPAVAKPAPAVAAPAAAVATLEPDAEVLEAGADAAPTEAEARAAPPEATPAPPAAKPTPRPASGGVAPRPRQQRRKRK
ncbi:MAG: protein translocase subunit SecF [Acidimicrobiia bacterium]|jgi:preprotein translocase subunit SecF